MDPAGPPLARLARLETKKGQRGDAALPSVCVFCVACDQKR